MAEKRNFQIRLSEELFQELNDEGKRRDVSKAVIIKDALKMYFEAVNRKLAEMSRIENNG